MKPIWCVFNSDSCVSTHDTFDEALKEAEKYVDAEVFKRTEEGFQLYHVHQDSEYWYNYMEPAYD